MAVIVYGYNGTTTLDNLHTGTSPHRKVVFLSKKSFTVTWTGPGSMSGTAWSKKTDITIGRVKFVHGWFATCRDPIDVNFTVKGGFGTSPANNTHRFPDLGWNAAIVQNYGLNGRVIIQRPNDVGPKFVTTSISLGVALGLAVAAVAWVVSYVARYASGS
jgi:hypothetical protein